MIEETKSKIVAIDYKGGKCFILIDSEKLTDDDFIRKEINVEYVINEGLKEHVENCIYYGIPPVLTEDELLNKRIKIIEDELDNEK